MKKPSFLIIANFSDDTGFAWHNIYRLFNNISIQLRKDGFTPLISFNEINNAQTEYFEHFEKQLLLPADLSKKENQERLISYIKEYNIKYLYLTDQRSSSFLYLKLKSYGIKKIIMHCRVSVPDPNLPAPENILKQVAKYCFSRIPLFTANRIICVSDFVRYRLQHKAKVPSSKLITISNGIDIEKYLFPIPSKKLSKKINLFTSGRATDHKGIKELIEAISTINKTSPFDISVRYAGNGPHLEEYKALAKKLDVRNFTFLGELKSVEKEVEKADLLIMPSAWGDAFPSSVIESMASGRPLITTKAGGIPEIVGSDDNAYLVPPGNSKALANAILQALEQQDTWYTMASRARHYVEGKFTLHNYHSNVWKEIYYQVIKSN